LTALSGYEFDLPRKALGFAPRLHTNDWCSFWSTSTGWGTYSQQLSEGKGEVSLSVAYGTLELQTLLLGGIMRRVKVVATLDDQVIEASAWPRGGRPQVHFAQPVRLSEGQALKVTLSW
jgi:hypothetical protein